MKAAVGNKMPCMPCITARVNPREGVSISHVEKQVNA